MSRQHTRPDYSEADMLELFVTELRLSFKKDFPQLTDWKQFVDLFTAVYFEKPVILIIDEFDTMGSDHINRFAAQFRHLCIKRQNETNNLYLYLQGFLYDYKSRIHPAFPTGNGKIDSLLHHGRQQYGLEVQSFANAKSYQEALKQAAYYGKQLGLAEISLIFFCEYISDENREKYEQQYQNEKTGVLVEPVFVATG